jgi:hypothetical protein
MVQEPMVAVGWPPSTKGYRGYHLKGKKPKGDQGWKRVRRLINEEIKIGDFVVVSLQGHRIGLIGEVTGKAIEDNEWDELVPKSKDVPNGQMGRRILLRWDMTTGPNDRDIVVKLPEGKRLNPGELRPTISEIGLRKLHKLSREMNNPANWESLFEFPYEKSLSDYIAAYPHRLEDGLLPHPNKKIRERRFADGKRVDVLLTDQADKPVIVECKQGEPTVANIRQIRD